MAAGMRWVLRGVTAAALIGVAWGCSEPQVAQGGFLASIQMGLDVARRPADFPLNVAECEEFSDEISWSVQRVNSDDPPILQNLEEVGAIQGGFDDDDQQTPLPNRCRYTTSVTPPAIVDGASSSSQGSYLATVVAVVDGEQFIESCEVGLFSDVTTETIPHAWAGFTFGVEGCVGSNSNHHDYEEFPPLP